MADVVRDPQVGETWTTIQSVEMKIVAGPDYTGHYAFTWPDGKLDTAGRGFFVKLVRDKPEWIKEFNDGNPSYVYFLDNGDGDPGPLFAYVQDSNSKAKRRSVARAVVNLETFEWL